MRPSQAIHDITYWVAQGVDRWGQPSYSSPIHVRGRWEDSERLYINEVGREVRGRSTVYLNSDLVKSGDYMLLGISDSPTPPPESFEVKQRRVVDNQRGTKTECRYIL